MSKCVVVFSGGPDSTATALWAVAQGYEAELLTLHFYSPSQDSEVEAAKAVAQELGLKHTIADLRCLMPTFGPPITVLMHGIERDEKANGDSLLSSSVMPFGPGFVLSLASAYALNTGANVVAWGATKDDALKRSEYKDVFGKKIAELVRDTYAVDFEIVAPLADLHKYEALEVYRDRADLFAKTWSCTKGGEKQSGNDGACKARRLAAMVAGVEDKTVYCEAGLEVPEKLRVRADGPLELSDDEWIRLFASEKGHNI